MDLEKLFGVATLQNWNFHGYLNHIISEKGLIQSMFEKTQDQQWINKHEHGVKKYEICA